MIVRTSYNTSAAALQAKWLAEPLKSQALTRFRTEQNSHCGQLRISIIRRCNLDNVGADEVQPVETANDCPQLACGPTSSFGGTGSRGNYT